MVAVLVLFVVADKLSVIVTQGDHINVLVFLDVFKCVDDIVVL
jgi:hypothetical protein